MQVVYPSYYSSFSCSASACPDTCCQGWGISIDRDTYGRYMAMGGLMGAKLRSHIDHRTRRFLLNREGRCVFLDRHGLCGICVDLGEDMMCRTCRIYPRHEESYGDLAEVSLSLSCPTAAELILNLDQPPVYRTAERRPAHPRASAPGSAGEELDEDFLCGLLEVRQSMFRLLRRTDMSEEARAGAALALAHDGESRLRRREFAGLREVCGRYETASGELLEKKLAPSREMGFQRRQLEEEYLDQLERLEEISGGWRELLRAARTSPGRSSVSFQPVTRQGLNLLEYFLYLLYPGAVYDGDGWSKAGLAMFSLLAVRRLAAGLEREGSEESFEKAFVRAAWLYSRQVEHSDANLERLETFVRESRSCALPQMLACLLGTAG